MIWFIGFVNYNSVVLSWLRYIWEVCSVLEVTGYFVFPVNNSPFASKLNVIVQITRRPEKIEVKQTTSGLVKR